MLTKMEQIVLIISIIFVFCEAATDLPDNMSQCKGPNTNQCFADNLKAGLNDNDENGFEAPELIIDVAPLTLSLKNLALGGLKNFAVCNPEINQPNQTIQLKLYNPHIRWHAKYSASLEKNSSEENSGSNESNNDIEGEGDIDFRDGLYQVNMQYVPYYENGEEYVNITNAEPIFDNVDIGSNFHELNSNPQYKAAWENMKKNFNTPAVAQFINQYLRSHFNQVFQKSPLNDVLCIPAQ